MCRLCERGVVITCVPGTAPVGKRVYFYQDHIVEEKTEREREMEKGLPCMCSLQNITQPIYSGDSLQMFGFVLFIFNVYQLLISAVHCPQFGASWISRFLYEHPVSASLTPDAS